MFGKTDNNQNKNQQDPKDDNVKKEAQIEKQGSVQPGGNESALNLPMLRSGSNEENIKRMNQMLKEANADNMLDLGEYDNQEEKIVPYHGNANDHIEESGVDDPNNSMYLDSSHNIVNDNNFINGVNVKDLQSSVGKKKNDEDKKDLSGSEENLLEIDTRSDETKRKEKEAKLKKQAAKDPVQNIIAPVIKAAAQQAANVPAQQEEEKPLFYVDPENTNEELNDPEHPINRDMVVEAPYVKKKNGKGKVKKSSKSKKSGNNINNVNQDMNDAAGWNFNAQKLPARKEAGWFRRFLTGTSYYAGRTIGKLFNLIGNIFYVPLTWSWSELSRSRSSRKDNPLVGQEKRDHETIPGWNGDKFDKTGDRPNDVIADFRRVPTVWSRLTAEAAVDSEGKVLPPKIGIYIDKPSEKEDKDINWVNFGHSGIGIEYSRYSRQTKRYERYQLRYGFYQSAATYSGGIMANSANVRVPGRLKDEYDTPYSVSRKFKATSKQVNDILRASESWADKGYNASTRNCTTFVKEMARDVAHLPLANDIFTEDHIRLSSLGNFGYFASSASKTSARMGMESQFDKMGQVEDTSYAGFGNKVYTKQEYRQYKDSLGKGLNRVTTADTPNSAAENMRRLEGKYAGEIDSYDYSGSIPKNADGDPVKSYQTVSAALNDEGKKITALILQLTGKSKEDINSLWRSAPDIVEMYRLLEADGAGSVLLEARYANGNPDSLRNTRKQMGQFIDKLNKLLFVYFKNDKRFHIPAMHMISLINQGISLIDNAYQNAVTQLQSDDELGNIRGEMESFSYDFSVGNNDVSMTPSHYESYIQIYKNAEEATRNYAEFKELKRIDNDPDQELTKEQKKRLKKLERIDELANQFDQSHRYMLEKGSYSQLDVDYAFSLSKKELANGDAGGRIFDKNKTAGNIYQALIYEKIFGGMKQRYLNQIKTKEQSLDIPALQAWLENDLNTCINRKKDDFIAVIRAISRNLDQKEPDSLFYEFRQSMNYNWFSKAFTPGDTNGPLANGPNVITEAFARILEDNQSQFKNKLTGITKFVLAEDEIAKPDSIQKIRD